MSNEGFKYYKYGVGMIFAFLIMIGSVYCLFISPESFEFDFAKGNSLIDAKYVL
jgi:hypothetical protein